MKLIATILATLLLTACSAIQIASDKVGEMALSAIGVTIPEKPKLDMPPKTILLKLDAAPDMNAGEDGNGLSVIFRIYKLKNADAFLNQPYTTFGNVEKEKETLSSDLVEVNELTLMPGQLVNLKETVTNEVGYIGVVTLFRLPSKQRWRFAFASANAVKSGITIGLHTCAMTATSTPPVGIAISESALLSPTRCKSI